MSRFVLPEEALGSLLLASHPNPIKRDELANFMCLALTTKGFTYAVSDLKKLGIAQGVGQISLTNLLFPEGLK